MRKLFFNILLLFPVVAFGTQNEVSTGTIPAVLPKQSYDVSPESVNLMQSYEDEATALDALTKLTLENVCTELIQRLDIEDYEYNTFYLICKALWLLILADPADFSKYLFDGKIYPDENPIKNKHQLTVINTIVVSLLDFLQMYHFYYSKDNGINNLSHFENFIKSLRPNHKIIIKKFIESHPNITKACTYKNIDIYKLIYGKRTHKRILQRAGFFFFDAAVVAAYLFKNDNAKAKAAVERVQQNAAQDGEPGDVSHNRIEEQSAFGSQSLFTSFLAYLVILFVKHAFFIFHNHDDEKNAILDRIKVMLDQAETGSQ